MHIKNSINSLWSVLMKPWKSMPNTQNLIAVISWKILEPFISEVVCIRQLRPIFSNPLIKEKWNLLKMKKLFCQLIINLDCAKSITINLNKPQITSYLHLIFLKKGILWTTKFLNNWLKHINCKIDMARLFYIMKNSLINMKESNFHRARFIKK